MRNDRGFTLIELLVVVAIIGILAAIAIPQFAAYKTRSFNARAQSDLRNALTAEEAYFVDQEYYTDCDNACAGVIPGYKQSNGVTMATATGGSGSRYAVATCHSRGDTEYDWASTNGVIVSSGMGSSCAPGATIS
jgi:type IV pilus assembly protein PilA